MVSNIISVLTWEAMKASKVKTASQDGKCAKIFRAYGCPDPIPVVGTFEADIEWKGKKMMARFYVLKRGEQSLLGSRTAKALGVYTMQSDVSN